MEFDFQNGEILLINKPYGWTSFDAVKKIRNLVKRKTRIRNIKVGHAGTLDPLATGLLIICTGKFTKRIDEFQGQEKEYTGKFFIGATTPSYDKESEVNQVFETVHISELLLKETAKKFSGEQDQRPPTFSAVNVNGTRAYLMARNKEDFELPAKRINIPEFEIVNPVLPEIEFRVVCSKGTYIRALARDFGLALNSGAYLTSLCRTRIGSLLLSDAMTMEEFERKLNPEET
jgi:tRNA pseudouridine55 synthase